MVTRLLEQKNQSLQGVEVVIDKDYASSRLAIEVDADVLLILTAVEKVYREFGLPSQIALDNLNLVEVKELLAEGQNLNGAYRSIHIDGSFNDRKRVFS